MEILKRVQRDYLVASWPAISQNIYMYPRAGKDIETAGQLGSCPQKNIFFFFRLCGLALLPNNLITSLLRTSCELSKTLKSPQKSIS